MELWELFVVLLFLYLAGSWVLTKLPDVPEKEEPVEEEPVTPFNSHPGPCLACGYETMLRGTNRLVSGGFRSVFEWPSVGNVVVTWWTCPNCLTRAKYGMHTEKPEAGWVALNRFLGGW